MPYNLAYAAAQADADMYQGATVRQDASKSRIVVLVAGQVVAIHPYRD